MALSRQHILLVLVFWGLIASVGAQTPARPKTGTLVLAGHVPKPITWTVAELKTLPRTSVTSNFSDNQIIVADTVDGKPLSDTQGPLRIVVPRDKRGARAMRVVERLEVVRLKK